MSKKHAFVPTQHNDLCAHYEGTDPNTNEVYLCGQPRSVPCHTETLSERQLRREAEATAALADDADGTGSQVEQGEASLPPSSHETGEPNKSTADGGGAPPPSAQHGLPTETTALGSTPLPVVSAASTNPTPAASPTEREKWAGLPTNAPKNEVSHLWLKSAQIIGASLRYRRDDTGDVYWYGWNGPLSIERDHILALADVKERAERALSEVRSEAGLAASMMRSALLYRGYRDGPVAEVAFIRCAKSLEYIGRQGAPKCLAPRLIDDATLPAHPREN
jgi:hypothetical protein